MQLFVELKLDSTVDPFLDPDDPLQPKVGDFRFERDTSESYKIRGQLASYAAALTGCQFRVHLFSVLICGEYARFIRWDRSGAIVTRRFDYSKQPHVLADFFWRYSHLNDRQRGYDSSVLPASPAEMQKLGGIKQRLQGTNPDHRAFYKVMG